MFYWFVWFTFSSTSWSQFTQDMYNPCFLSQKTIKNWSSVNCWEAMTRFTSLLILLTLFSCSQSVRYSYNENICLLRSPLTVVEGPLRWALIVLTVSLRSSTLEYNYSVTQTFVQLSSSEKVIGTQRDPASQQWLHFN